MTCRNALDAEVVVGRGGVVRRWCARGAPAVLAGVLLVGMVGVAPAGTAVPVPSGPGTVAGGEYHACAVAAGGTVKCWGLDNSGQAGDGGPADSFSMHTKPVAVIGLSGVTAVANGDSHSCALLKVGTVKCWGLNDAGQLGNGTRANSSKPVSVKGVHGSGLLTGVITLAAAQGHTCALLAAGAGTVKCWGRNLGGVLGNGSATGLSALTPESVTGLTRVNSISTSVSDTCAVLKGGSVKCWGFNQYGELGPGTSGPDSCSTGEFDHGCSTTPVTVKGISNVIAVSVRNHSSCAVVKNGRAVCWGDSKKTFSTVPGVSGATAITSSADSVSYGDYSCVLTVDKTVKCWGYNHEGQLGNGTNKNSNVATAVVGLSGVSAVSAGVTFACARMVAGAAVCWGANSYGQLGNGGGPSKMKPVKVIGL